MPDDSLDSVFSDVDEMNRSVDDVGNHLKPGADPLHLDEPDLAKYRREVICKSPGQKADILSTFKEVVSAARRGGPFQEFGARVRRARTSSSPI